MNLLDNALPEFLGSLGAGLVFALGSWTTRWWRRRRTTETPPPD
ncbi:hypothetical protein [Streptomyces xanthophaeus]|nr:hypothetical protein [Streptomyces xanthophaeus]